MTFRGWLRVLAGGWAGRKRSEQLREVVSAHLNVLPVANAQLLDTNRQMEQAVAQVGRSFERMVEGAREGANQASRLVGGAASEDGSAGGVDTVLASTRTTLEDMLVRILGDGAVCRSLVNRTAALERDMGQIVKALESVDRISLANTILALNAKIEAAHMGERGEAFGLVADELWRQSRQSEKITEEIRDTILRLAEQTKAATGEIARMACADAAGIEDMRVQVHDALDRLKDAHDKTGQVLADGQTRNQSLTDEIAAAVQAMQFQDRVSQQLTHIVEALESMQTAMATTLGPGDAARTDAAHAMHLLSESYTMEGERSVHAAVTGEVRAVREDLDDVEIF